MENLNEIKDNIVDNAVKIKDNVVDNIKDFKENIENNVGIPAATAQPKNFLDYSKEFLQSNTIIAKATFLLLVIIVFVFLFKVLSKIIIFFMTPSETPYLVYGMKDATQTLTVPQSFKNKGSVQIYRSIDEYDGIEFTYSFWMYITNIDYNEKDYYHVFHKGSLNAGSGGNIYGPNTCPGVYLYKGRRNLTDATNLIEKYPELGMLVRLNVFHNNDDVEYAYKYYDDIYVNGIPIKKWVGVIIRVTSQNVVDIYINGTLSKRHKLSNIIKQNYDDVHINRDGGYPGNLSNLKYYNYAIGTFEIEKITANGPNLTMADNANITRSKPEYLSPQWYYNSINIV